MTERESPRIAVLGSINMDLIVRCAELPAVGQTVLAESSSEFCGGKGANQAVASATAGGNVAMIGAVGGDVFADRLLDNLHRHRVDFSAVQRRTDTASGLAVIAVDSRGQNSIMVVPGSNGLLTAEDVMTSRETIQKSDMLLVQMEISIDAVLAGIRLARDAGVRVVLDPAPASEDYPPELFQVDLLCPNESEAETLSGHSVTSIDNAQIAAKELRRRGARNVAITMGESGTLLHGEATGNDSVLVPAFSIDAIDTTAAGDAFAGALAVQWSLTDDLHSAVQFANAAGALAASKPGAKASMPSRIEIETLRSSQS